MYNIVGLNLVVFISFRLHLIVIQNSMISYKFDPHDVKCLGKMCNEKENELKLYKFILFIFLLG